MTVVPVAGRRPRLSRGFKVFLAVVAVVLVVFGLVRFVGALGLHHDAVAEAHNQVFLVDRAIVTPKQGVAYGVDGVNGINNPTTSTSAERVGSRDFVLTVTATDGYVSHYDSRTGFYTGGCASLGCWFS